jgi:hypothetical protein
MRASKSRGSSRLSLRRLRLWLRPEWRTPEAEHVVQFVILKDARYGLQQEVGLPTSLLDPDFLTLSLRIMESLSPGLAIKASVS